MFYPDNSVEMEIFFIFEATVNTLLLAALAIENIRWRITLINSETDLDWRGIILSLKVVFQQIVFV